MAETITAAQIDAKVNAVLARLEDTTLKAEVRESLRRILDQLLDAREDLILGDLASAAAKVSVATQRLQDLTSGAGASAAGQPPVAPGGTAGGVPPASSGTAPSTPPAGSSNGSSGGIAPAWQADYEQLIGSAGLRHFKPYELLVKGAAHTNPGSRAFGLNTDPPRDLWGNIIPTVRVLDELRHRLQATIILSSVYRSPAYNRAIGGAGDSVHMRFNAIDFVVRGIPTGPQDWAAALRDMRQSGMFKGGIGTYASFVHVDTRGNNADWSG